MRLASGLFVGCWLFWMGQMLRKRWKSIFQLRIQSWKFFALDDHWTKVCCRLSFDIEKVVAILIDHLHDFTVYLDNFLWIKLIVSLHRFAYFKHMIFPIQNDNISLIVEDSINDWKRYVKKSLKPIFESVFNRPSVVPIGVNSIQVIVVLAPYKPFDLFTNWEAFHKFVVLVCFMDIAFWSVLSADDQWQKLARVRVKHLAAICHKDIFNVSQLAEQNLVDSHFWF